MVSKQMGHIIINRTKVVQSMQVDMQGVKEDRMVLEETLVVDK